MDGKHLMPNAMCNNTNISAIMPTFAPRNSYIKTAIQQFFNSDIAYTNKSNVTIELIIIDDSIENKTAFIMEEQQQYKNKTSNIYITYIHLNYTSSIGEKRNVGIKKACGDVIILIDDDDLYFPDRIVKQCSALLISSSLDGNEVSTTSKSLQIDVVIPRATLFYQLENQAIYYVSNNNINHAPLLLGTVAFRKALFSNPCIYPHTSLDEDHAFIACITTSNALNVQIIPSREIIIRHYGNTWSNINLNTIATPLINDYNKYVLLVSIMRNASSSTTTIPASRTLPPHDIINIAKFSSYHDHDHYHRQQVMSRLSSNQIAFDKQLVQQLQYISNEGSINMKLFLKWKQQRAHNAPDPYFDVRRAGLSPDWLRNAPQYGTVLLEQDYYLHERILYRTLNTTGTNISNLTNPDEANNSNTNITHFNNSNTNITHFNNATNGTNVTAPSPNNGIERVYAQPSPSPLLTIDDRVPSTTPSLLEYLLSFPFYYYIVFGILIVLIALFMRHLKKKLYDKCYLYYYKCCGKFKTQGDNDESTPRFDDEVHVDVVPDVLIEDKWHPPPAQICRQCKQTLTLFNTSEHSICTTCNHKKTKAFEDKKTQRYQQFLAHKLKLAKEAKMLQKKQQLLELGIMTTDYENQRKKQKKKKKNKRKKRKIKDSMENNSFGNNKKKMEVAATINGEENGIIQLTGESKEETITSTYVTDNVATSGEINQHDNIELKQPAKHATDGDKTLLLQYENGEADNTASANTSSIPKVYKRLPPQAVIRNSMLLRQHAKSLSSLRDKYIKKRMKKHVIINTTFGSKQFTDMIVKQRSAKQEIVDDSTK